MTTPLPLHWKVAAVPAALAIVLVASVLGLSQWLLNGYLEDRAAAGMRQAGAGYAYRLDKALEQRCNDLRMLARVEGLQGLDPQRLRVPLNWALRYQGGTRALSVVDEERRVIASTDPQLEGRQLHPRLELPGVAEEVWIGPPRPRQDDESELVVEMALPIVAPDGHQRTSLVAQIEWSWFVALRDPILGLDAGGRRDGLDLGIYTLVEHRLLSRLTSLEIDGGLPAPPGASGIPMLPEYGKVETTSGRELLVMGVPLTERGDLGWQVLAAQDLAVALLPSHRLQRSVAAAGLLAALLYGAIGYGLSRRMMRPYERLLEAMTQRLREANAPGRGGLVRYLDVLTAHARDLPVPAGGPAGVAPASEQRPLTPREVLALLAQDATRLQLMLNGLPSGVMLCDVQFRILYVNDACRRMFGGTEADFLGHTLQESLTGGDAAQSIARLQTLLPRQPEVQGSCHLVRRNGEPMYCEWYARQASDASGSFVGYLIVANGTTVQRQAQLRAAEMAANLRILVDAASDYSFVLLDEAGHIRTWSPAAEQLNGHGEGQTIGRPLSMLFAEDTDPSAAPQALLERARREGRAEYEGWCVKSGGQRFWANVTVYRLGPPDDTSTGFAMVARDLTERRSAQLRQQSNQAMLAAIVDSASDAIISTDEHGLITLFNPAAERIFGHGANHMQGRTLDDLLPAHLRQEHRLNLARFADSMSTRRRMGASGQVQGIRSDGSVLELEASISQITVNERKFLTAILRDVTARVQAQRELRQYQSELKALTQRLLSQEKETTQRIAQSLHDRLGQTLLAIRLSCEALQAAHRRQGDTQLLQLDERIGMLIAQAFVEVRRVLMDLRPPLLDEEGLAVALDNELRSRSGASSGVALVLDAQAAHPSVRWPAEVEYAAFMVAREAVTNALKHGQPSRVRVMLSGDAEGLVLRIEDDGVGLPGGQASVKPGHLGVVGMRERALAIDAEFSIRESPTGGTVVELRWSAPS